MQGNTQVEGLFSIATSSWWGYLSVFFSILPKPRLGRDIGLMMMTLMLNHFYFRLWSHIPSDLIHRHILSLILSTNAFFLSISFTYFLIHLFLILFSDSKSLTNPSVKFMGTEGVAIKGNMISQKWVSLGKIVTLLYVLRINDSIFWIFSMTSDCTKTKIQWRVV